MELPESLFSVVAEAPTVSVTVMGVEPRIPAAVVPLAPNFRIKELPLPAGLLIVNRREVTDS